MRQNAHPISRGLAYLIDYLLVYNSAFMILHFFVGIEPWNAIRLSYVISIFYNVLFVLYFDGSTIGKRISRLRVTQEGLNSPVLMNILIREVAKILIIIPVFGIFILIINLVLLAMRRRLLHDLLSETRVIYAGRQ